MLQLWLPAFTVSLDLFFTAVAYGMSGIRIPFSAAWMLSGTGAVFFFFAMEMAKLSGLWLPASFCRIASIVLLAAMGGVMLLKDLVKPIKKETAAPDLRTVYFDAETADADHSHSLSVKEAVLLAVALSMDSLAVGIGIGWQNNRPVGIALFTLLFGVVGTSVGTKIGTRLHRKRKWHGSWMSGVCLLLLALLQAVQG